MLENLIRSTIEWQNWGLNALTISFVATVLLGIAHAWSMAKQHRTIQVRSAGDLEPLVFSYIAGVMFAFLVNGIAVKSAAMALNGLLGIPYLVIFTDTIRIENVFGTGREPSPEKTALMWSLVFGFPAVMWFVPDGWKPLYLFAIMGGSLVPLAKQAFKLWRERRAKSVDVRYFLVFATSCMFWLIYGIAIGNWALWSVNIGGTSIAFAIVAARLKFGDGKSHKMAFFN